MSLEPFLSLLLYQLAMSLLSVGGVITLASEQHRHMVLQQQWLTDAQFQASITLAQVAPGPNVLFLALWGWHVGLNSVAAAPAAPAAAPGAWPGVEASVAYLAAFTGLAVCLVGALAPSSVLAVLANRWSRRHAQRNGVRALRQGLAPIVVGAMLATAWVLVQAGSNATAHDLATPLIAGLAMLMVWCTRVHLLVLLGAGALLGAALHTWG